MPWRDIELHAISLTFKHDIRTLLFHKHIPASYENIFPSAGKLFACNLLSYVQEH